MADFYEALILALFLCGGFLIYVGLYSLTGFLCRKSVTIAGICCFLLQFIDRDLERDVRRELIVYHRKRGNL